ncbi:MAG TPA: tetraacyldisaccharide 4'-kinase [Acidobacteriaceae bacterium]|jgi:tetraacyldisaccharide 4'-kinase
MSARRPWAWPLVPAYRAAAALDAVLYRLGALRTRRLRWPVVSIGSVSAGGAGKTPVVIALAALLREHGWHVDVLSRGYGRSGREVEKVPAGADAGRFGDEPTLIAERTGLPVWVGPDRFTAGQCAEGETLPQRPSGSRRIWRDRTARTMRSGYKPAQFPEEPVLVHLLDDGFQHKALVRDFDIVLITAEDLDDVLLPAGNLREPLVALRRADALVMREEEREDVEARVREIVGCSVPLWSIRRSLRFPQPLGVFSAGLRPVAFCGLARPEGFAAMLAEAGCGVVETVAFHDHHVYTLADAEHILKIARNLNATGLLTTEKDAVKLTPELRKVLSALGPLATVALDADFVFKAPVIRALEARLHPPARPRTEAASNAGEARLR